jgi:predicted ArsR family transcriptional regulator
MARHGLVDTDPAEDRQLRRWYERDGLTIPQIAGRLDVHPRTARRRLIAAGITLRPPGRRAVIE